MKRFLATPDRDAYFDFLSLLVVMSTHENRDLADLQNAITWEPGQEIDFRTAKLRALLKHEITHFLDTTTTVWGGQYTFRKLRMLCAVQGNTEGYEDAGSVFALESSEIEMHSELTQAGAEPPASCDVVKHQLVDRAEYGVCVLVHYLKNGQTIHKVPLSMLSLLEANATASEFLSFIQCAQSQDDAVARKIETNEIEQRYLELLNDSERLEYSVFLHLVRIHFPYLDLSEQLKFVAALARYSLDSTFANLGYISNAIQRSFDNKELGDRICMELRRDSCKYLIFFKTVLLMYGWLKNLSDARVTEIQQHLRESPLEAIKQLWADQTYNQLMDDRAFRDLHVKSQETWMHELGVPLADGRIFGESQQANRAALERTSAGLLSFTKLRLLAAMLSDDTELVFPNRIDISVAAYCNEHLQTISSLDAAYRKMQHKRFYLDPSSDLIIRSSYT